jgi:hypothetical protein
MATASLRELDPPMHHAPFPAGFPLRGESPRLLAEEVFTDRLAKQQLRKELAEQEPRYENSLPPYPSGPRTLLALRNECFCRVAACPLTCKISKP